MGPSQRSPNAFLSLRQRIAVGLCIALPVPVFAGSGMAVPLASVVYRLAVAAGARTEAVAVDVSGFRLETAQEAAARTGTIRLTDAERAAPEPAPEDITAAVRADTALLLGRRQLKVDMRTGSPVGAEALVRWRHPTRGLLPPGDFVPLAERTGATRMLSRYVLRQVVRKLREWSSRGVDLPIAVNLTMFDLLDLTLPDELAALLEREGVDPSMLELEITEGVIMADPVRVGEVVGGLKAIGVTIAIDDFGTGYSSLSYLKTLPIDVIKIDRTFVLGMTGDASDHAIVRSTIDLAHNLGLTVVAEGVETEAVRDDLRNYRCDMAQGFLVGRPCPEEKLGSVLAAWARSAVVAKTVGARAPDVASPHVVAAA